MSRFFTALVLLSVVSLWGCQDKTAADNAGETVSESSRSMDLMLARSLTIHEDHDQALIDIGIEKVLNPQRVAKDSSFVESKRILRLSRQARTRYDRRMDSLTSATIGTVGEMGASSKDQAKFYQTLNKDITSLRAMTDTLKSLEYRLFDGFDSVFTLLAEQKGKWHAEGQEFVFDSKEVDKKYTAMKGDIRLRADQYMSFSNKLREMMEASYIRIVGKMPR